MKNRYIPFGYQIQNGDSVINTEQAATVQHIFYAYTEGQSFKEIAEYLTTSGTAYHFSDNSWNKNIVARILANEIYCGAKGYPAIISKEVYSQAASIRSNKTVTYSAVAFMPILLSNDTLASSAWFNRSTIPAVNPTESPANALD